MERHKVTYNDVPRVTQYVSNDFFNKDEAVKYAIEKIDGGSTFVRLWVEVSFCHPDDEEE